jgi:hypothetical protein
LLLDDSRNGQIGGLHLCLDAKLAKFSGYFAG